MISKEAENLLFEIIEHESDGNFWAERFEAADHREDTILRGCFKELKDNNLVHAVWADNIPVIIQVLKDGYLYQQHKEEQEKETNALQDYLASLLSYYVLQDRISELPPVKWDPKLGIYNLYSEHLQT